MDRRNSVFFALLFCVNTLIVYAAIEPYCKGQSLQNDYDNFLKKLPMGYKIPGPSADMAGTVEGIKKNTVCGIQTICLSIMRFTATRSICDIDAHTLRTRIHSFYKIPLIMMVILYNIGAVYADRVLYPIWQFYLYVQDIFSYWNHFDSVRMSKVHEMITEQLLTSMEGCPGQNEFDVTYQNSRLYYDYHSRLSPTTSESSRFSNMQGHLNQHFDVIRQNLIEVTRENYNLIDLNNLFFNTESFLWDDGEMWDYQSLYGKHIRWGDAGSKLLFTYMQAKKPDILYDGLQGIKNFHHVYMTQMKMVKLRLLWTHLLLVTKENRPEVNAKMYETAYSFARVTGLDDDQAFIETVDFLNVENPSPDDSQAAIENIRSQLIQSCLLFTDCDATNAVGENVSEVLNEVIMFINGYAAVRTKEVEYKDEAKKPLTDPSDVQKNLKLAVLFLKHVECLLRNVDMDFVKSVLALAYTISKDF